MLEELLVLPLASKARCERTREDTLAPEAWQRGRRQHSRAPEAHGG